MTIFLFPLLYYFFVTFSGCFSTFLEREEINHHTSLCTAKLFMLFRMHHLYWIKWFWNVHWYISWSLNNYVIIFFNLTLIPLSTIKVYRGYIYIWKYMVMQEFIFQPTNIYIFNWEPLVCIYCFWLRLAQSSKVESIQYLFFALPPYFFVPFRGVFNFILLG